MSHFERNEDAAGNSIGKNGDASQALIADTMPSSLMQNPFALARNNEGKVNLAWNNEPTTDVTTPVDQYSSMNNRQDQIAQQAQNTRIDNAGNNYNNVDGSFTNTNRNNAEANVQNNPNQVNSVGIENNPNLSNKVGIGIENNPNNTLSNKVGIENNPTNTVGIDNSPVNTQKTNVGVDAHSGSLSSANVGDVKSSSTSGVLASGNSSNVYSSQSKSYSNYRGEALPGNQCQTFAFRADANYLGTGGGIGISNSDNECIKAIAKKITCDAPAALADANARNSAAAQSWLAFANDAQRAAIINHGIATMQHMSDNAAIKSDACTQQQ